MSYPNPALLKAIAEEISGALVDRYGVQRPYQPGRCIVASAVGLRVYPVFGYSDVRDISLALAAITPDLYRRALNGEQVTANNQVMPSTESAGHPALWVGHVGLLVDGTLTDSTADQLSLPAENLYCPTAVVTPTTGNFFNGNHEGLWHHSHDAVLFYAYTPGNQGYQTFPFWRDEKRLASISNRVLERLDARHDVRDMPKILPGSSPPPHVMDAASVFGLEALNLQRYSEGPAHDRLPKRVRRFFGGFSLSSDSPGESRDEMATPVLPSPPTVHTPPPTSPTSSQERETLPVGSVANRRSRPPAAPSTDERSTQSDDFVVIESRPTRNNNETQLDQLPEGPLVVDRSGDTPGRTPTVAPRGVKPSGTSLPPNRPNRPGVGM